MKTLTLDVSKWRCGSDGDHRLGQGSTLLLNDEGFMCCLGQFSLQLSDGLQKQDITGLGEPTETDKLIPYLTEREKGGDIVHTKVTDRAIFINDDSSTTPEVKIKQLTQLFEPLGYKIKVKNK